VPSNGFPFSIQVRCEIDCIGIFGKAEKEQKASQALVNRMGVDPEHGWEAHYEVLPGKDFLLQ
jgi:hypothetical protein